ncbi:MAG: 3-hydroxy-3-methylglutaryl-CoA reductase, partial [Candidatus Omnitrophica bacterium]|nr:3-hydroxy-3-methylglutaryl-CoA reductase [Candidatus Omnitrophota bacterium]
RATEAACKYISKKTNKKYCLRSHYSSIKGASSNIIHQGQAKAIFADIIIPKKILAKYLRVTPEETAAYYMSSLVTAVYANRLGHSAHIANGITAIFIACGQDVADVSVSHIGISSAEVTETGDLYVSTLIPNLFVGTVGGGTGLGTQKECLQILDCYGKNKVKKF